VHQTSWGVSTRLIGALIMTHGDDQGLKLPPHVAPVQAVVVPIWRKPEEKTMVLEHVARVRAALSGRVRIQVDDREQYTPGWKYNEHELRGVPVRIEVGPKDVAQNAVMTVRRDDRTKESVSLDRLAERVPALLEEIQAALFAAARTFREQNTATARTLSEIEAHFADRRGFLAVPWTGDAKLEADIKERTGATLRCVPLDASSWDGLAPKGQSVAIFAKAY
jgi:prolyl-tRNA synthetase